MSSLSIVVPCYNEEDNILRFIEDWYKEISDKLDNFEIIIVDDASKDSTPKILNDIIGKYSRVNVIRNEINKKYGETVARGIRNATKEYVIWVDSDYSHYPKDIWKLWEYREYYDAVWGIRGVTQRDSRTRLIFTAGNIVLTMILFQLFLRDPNCAFKLYRREIILSVLNKLCIHPIMTTTKTAIKTKQMKLSVKEVPVAYLKRSNGSGSIKHIQAVCAGLKEMILFRIKGK